VVSLAGMLAVGSGPAAASYKFARAFGGTGGGDGKFKKPSGIADIFFQPIYVTDTERQNLQYFNENGSFFQETPGFGASINKLKSPTAVAGAPYGPESGNAYTVDDETGRVEEFDHNDGQTVRTFAGNGSAPGKLSKPGGIAVSPVAPYNVYVADGTNLRISEFSRTGNFIRTFGQSVLSFPHGVAIGPSGRVYVADVGDQTVKTFGPKGQFKRSWAVDPQSGVGDPYDLAVDAESYVYVNGLCGEVGKFTSDGKFITTIGKYSGPGNNVISCPVSIDVSSFQGQETVAVLDANNKVRVWDAKPPNTTKVSGPEGDTSDTSPTFKFHSSETGSTFQCSFDNVEWKKCGETKTFHLDEGFHLIQVRAVDAERLRDWSPLNLSFTVDTTPPTTTITSGPSGNVADSTPSFGFESNESSTFKCAIDLATPVSCTSPFTAAAQSAGQHTFSVVATDPAGNPDPSPATRSFNVTIGAPDTTITSGGGLTNDATPAFSFVSTVAGSTFECQLNALGFGPCTSPFTFPVLADGSYTFSVRATANAATDATPASAAFTVDTTAPTSTITDGPSGNTQNHTPTFKFKANDPQASFECRVDDNAWHACTSPDTTGHQGLGDHTYKVRATDQAGNVEAQPSTRDFTVTN
jgi:hypothetical protein